MTFTTSEASGTTGAPLISPLLGKPCVCWLVDIRETRARATGTAALVPEPLGQGKTVCAVGGVVDRIGDVNTGSGGQAVEVPAGCLEPVGDTGVCICLVPQRTGKYWCLVLMAGSADSAAGVADGWVTTVPIIMVKVSRTRSSVTIRPSAGEVE